MSDNLKGSQPVYFLRDQYKVTNKTWQTWINKIPGLNVSSGQRIYTPAQVEMIIKHLGEP